jgi:amino acid permease
MDKEKEDNFALMQMACYIAIVISMAISGYCAVMLAKNNQKSEKDKTSNTGYYVGLFIAFIIGVSAFLILGNKEKLMV